MERLHIINDDTPESQLVHPGKGRGLDLSARPRGYAYGDVAEPFPTELLIPQSEWQARIQELKATKSRIPDLCDNAGLKVKDQQSTNYCWCNGPTHCLEITEVLQGNPTVSLSPASVGAQITGYRNRGGWGLDALKWIVANGAAPSSLWPDNAIDSRYATPATLAAAKMYEVQEWWEAEPGNLDQMVSAILRGFPCAVGYNWWSHEVSGVALDWLDGQVALIIDNSWGTSWGTNGRGVLQGKRMLADDIVIPRTSIAA